MSPPACVSESLARSALCLQVVMMMMMMMLLMMMMMMMMMTSYCINDDAPSNHTFTRALPIPPPHQRHLSLSELSNHTDAQLKHMLIAREAWHALADVQVAGGGGQQAERTCLLNHVYDLQTWPTPASPVIGVFCGDDIVPRINENNV